MNIYFYNNGSPENKINKTLSNEKLFPCTLKESIDISNPVIILNISPSDMVVYNYVYIPVFKRYYYITNIQILNNNICAISCKVDVLMSFKSDINNASVILNKSGSTKYQNKYINGSEIITDSRKNVQVINFDYGFSESPNYILMTVGG